MFRNALAPAVLVAALLAPAASAIPGPGDDIVQFAQDIQAASVALKSSLKALDAQFATDIAAMQSAYLAGTADAPTTHGAVFDRLVTLDNDVSAALAVYTDAVETSASTHLQNILSFPNAFAVGDDGLIDGAIAKGLAARVKSTVTNFKKVHKLAALMKIIDNYDLIFDRRGQELQPMTPSNVNGVVADAPAKTLRIDLLMAGSAKPAQGDGALDLAGTANIGGTDHVVVSIDRPGDAPVNLNGTIDQSTGRWTVKFSSLPEGNYAITVSQDTVAVSDSLAIQ